MTDKWQYKVEEIRVAVVQGKPFYAGDASRVIDFLNNQGSQGWEAYSTLETVDHYDVPCIRIYMKRKIG